MGDTPQLQLQETGTPRVSVSVSVEYWIDPRGTAKVKDVKILKNDGSSAASLSGVFKQAVNHNVWQMNITDSLGKSYPHKIIRGDDHHQVAVAIEVPKGEAFTIDAGTQRSLTFEYEMSGATTPLVGSSEPTVLINNRFGSVTYPYEFATIEYNIKYHIEKPTSSNWLQRIFNRPTLLMHPPEMTFQEDKTHFDVEYHFSCDAKSVKYVHMAFVFQPRRWAQTAGLFLLGAASSLAATYLVMFLSK